MTTYPKKLLTDAIYSDKPLRPFQISYFGERYRNRLHAEVLKLFHKECQKRGLTKADLARRLNKRPEQITRWLSAPGNWTLDTVSELMLAMGYEPIVGSQMLAESVPSNYYHPASVKPSVPLSTSITLTKDFPAIEAQKIPVSMMRNKALWKSGAHE